MLSAIVFSSPAPAGRSDATGPLMRTLAALVPAAVEGVVRDVTLLSLSGDDDLATLADEAGCRIVGGASFAEALARAVALARSMSLLVLKAGAVPSRLFGEEVAQALGPSRDDKRALVLREEPTGALARVLPGLLAPVAGVIVPRARLANAPCEDFAEVVRRARPATPLPSPVAVRAR